MSRFRVCHVTNAVSASAKVRPVGRKRDERGSTIVEAAFALPIIFLLMGGAIDIGFWLFQNTQVVNAARDGDRVAILDYLDADANPTIPGSVGGCAGITGFSSTDNLGGCPDLQAIQNAIAAHIGKAGFIHATVTCFSGTSTTPTSCNNPCLPATGAIQVTVTAPQSSAFYILPVFGSSLTRSASLAIVGNPGDSSGCAA